MAKSQETFNKKELEKKKLQKRKEKEQRKEERKAKSKEGQSWEDMLAYVDENGNITSAPPDPNRKKSTVKAEDIVTGSRNLEGHSTQSTKTGKVTFFNDGKGFGFIRDSSSGESVFVHSKNLLHPIKENDLVSFETERGPKGLSAVRVTVVR